MSRAQRRQAREERELSDEAVRFGLGRLQAEASKLLDRMQAGGDDIESDLNRRKLPRHVMLLDDQPGSEFIMMSQVADNPSRMANAIRSLFKRPLREPIYDWQVTVPVGDPEDDKRVSFMLSDRRPGTAIAFEGRRHRRANVDDISAASAVIREQI